MASDEKGLLEMYECPMTAVTNYHKLNISKQHIY